MATVQLESVIAELDLDVKNLDAIDRATKKLEQYEKQAKDTALSDLKRQDAQRKANILQGKLGKANDNFNRGLTQTNKGIQGNALSLKNLGRVAGPVVAAVFSYERLQEFVKLLRSVDKEYNTLRKTIKRFSDLNDTQAGQAATRAKALSMVYGESAENIVKATNNFAKQMKIDFVEAFDLVEKGFLKGANSQGQFLENLKEYPVQFKNAKLSADEFIKVATQEATGGVYSDKLLDTIKELGLSLRELTKAQLDALKPLGEEFNKQLITDLRSGNKDIIEIFNNIIKRSKEVGLNTQQLQTLVADLGKGATEDLGGLEEAFAQLNAAMNINLDTTDELGKEQKALLDLTNDLTAAEGRLARNVEGINAWFERASITIKTSFVEALNSILDPYAAINKRNDEFNRFVESASFDDLTKQYTKVGQSVEYYKEALSKLDPESYAQSGRYKELAENLKVAEKQFDLLTNKLRQGNKKQDKEELPVSTEVVKLTTEEIEKQRKKLSEYEEMIKRIGFAFRESEANLSGQFLAATQRAEIGIDKVIDDLEKDIERLKKAGKEAGISDIKINAQIEYLKETAKNDIQVIKRTLAEEIKLSGGGLIDGTLLFDSDTENIRKEFKELGLLGTEGPAKAKAEEESRQREEKRNIESLERRKAAYADFYNSVKQAAIDLTNIQIQQIDREIRDREAKINYLQNIQSASAERALQQERQNIDKAIQQRKKFEAAQRAIALLEAGINIVSGISKVFAETGVGAIAAVPITLGVLGGFLAAVPSFLNSFAAYEHGGAITGGKQLALVNEKGTEFVANADAYKASPKLLNMINDGVVTDATFANMQPIVNMHNGGGSSSTVSTKRMEGILSNIERKVSGQTIHNHKWDEKGYHKRTQRLTRAQEIRLNRA